MTAEHRQSVIGAAIVSAVAVGLFSTGRVHGAGLVAAGLAIVVGMALEVDLPWGGRVPLGYAVVIAAAVLISPLEMVLVIASALAGLAAIRTPVRTLVIVAAGSALVAVARLGQLHLLGDSRGDLSLLGQVLLVGSVFLVVDLVVGRRKLAQVAALYVTMLCASALLAIAFSRAPTLSLVALVPLVVTKYSFGRLTDARSTYAQTTQALSLLPEVAGLTPLGHGERTAVYASALAEALGFDRPGIDRIATAARLHHLGYISLHEADERPGPLDRGELAQIAGELLRETGFLDDIAGLVEQAQAGGPPAATLEAAVIRVSSSLDDATEQGTDSTRDPFASVLVGYREGLERTAAIALLALHDRRPGLLEEARAASVALTSAAAGHDQQEVPMDGGPLRR